MKSLGVAAVLVAATCALAQETRPQACPVCRRPGAAGATTCSKDDTALVDADLVVLRVVFHHLELDPAALGDFVRCETTLPPYRVAAPPPDFAKDRRYCPECLLEVQGERCICGRAPVGGTVLTVQTTFAYMALLQSTLGENPFVELLDAEGGVDRTKLRALAERYGKARKALELGDVTDEPWPLVHPVLELGTDMLANDKLSLIAGAEAAYHQKNGRFADLATLEAAGLVRTDDATWAFTFDARPSRSKPRKRWYATASRAGTFTNAWYFMNQEGKLYRASRPRSVDEDDVDTPESARLVDFGRPCPATSGPEREATAIGALRRIAAAQSIRIARENGRAGTLAELCADGLLDPVTARGTKNGYELTVAVATSSSWCAAALPAGGAGRRFTVDAAGNVFELDASGRPGPVVLPGALARSRTLPDIATGYLRCGTEHLYKAEWLEGVEPLETALALDGGSVPTWNNVGKAYLEIQSSDSILERALACFERGIVLDHTIPSPSVALCHNNAALAQMKLAERAAADAKDARRERLASAAAHLEIAVHLDAGYATAWINLATARIRWAELVDGLERRKLADEAIDAIDGSRVGRGSPLRSIAILDRGLAARLVGRHAESFEAVQELAEDDAESRKAVLAMLGEEAAAVADELALLPEADSEDARAELARAQKMKPILARALPFLEELASSATPDQKAHLERGAARIALRVLDDLDRAKSLYEAAIRHVEGGAFKAQLVKEREALSR
jgi:tetratricopeptide (TPR) repeat protein